MDVHYHLDFRLHFRRSVALGLIFLLLILLLWRLIREEEAAARPVPEEGTEVDGEMDRPRLVRTTKKWA